MWDFIVLYFLFPFAYETMLRIHLTMVQLHVYHFFLSTNSIYLKLSKSHGAQIC